MSDENKIRDAADAIKGVVEAVPVYKDAIQPAAKEIGTALQTVTKAVNIALAPLALVVWGYEQIRDYLQETLAKKLKDVPPEQIVPPKISIAGPVVEQMRFTSDEPYLRELYANLLATSMDNKTMPKAHPAFIDIIRQLSPDEARLLAYLVKQKYRTFFLTTANAFTLDRVSGRRQLIWRFCPTVLEAGCSHPNLLDCYVDNFCRLGIMEFKRNPPKEKPGGAELLKRHHEQYGHITPSNLRGITFITEFLRLTSFGSQFCEACIEEDTHS